jgi:rhodanese-related sulfurtransferase
VKNIHVGGAKMDKIITPMELTALLQSGNKVTLLDVRRKEDYDKSPAGIGDAQWRDPAAVTQWLPTLPAQQEVVLYCVRGGSVSQAVQKQLAEAGIQARYVEGGIEAFQKG